MKTIKLIEILQAHVKKHGANSEVRLMVHPQWPFETEVLGAVTGETLNEACPSAVYLVEGSQIAYGEKAAWELAGGSYLK